MVIALALLAALIVPGLHGRPVVGHAVRGPEPLVGDCVVATSPPPDPAAVSEGRPMGETAACSAPGAARVIARFPLVGVPARRPARGVDQLTPLCRDAIQAQKRDLQGGPFSFTWIGGEVEMLPALNLSAIPLTPGPAATERGERWLACGAATPDKVGRLVASSTPIQGIDVRWTVCGTEDLRTLLQSGDFYSQLTVPCDRPHRWQLLGSASGARYDENRPLPDLTGVCNSYAQAAIGHSDPSAWDGLFVDTPSLAPEKLDCVMGSIDGRLLSGSLLALGGKPIPWN